MQILLYVTNDKERYLGGDPLTLFFEPTKERDDYLFALAKSLGGDVIQMENGDHFIVRNS